MSPLKVYISKIGTLAAAGAAVVGTILFDLFAKQVFTSNVFDWFGVLKPLTIGIFVAGFVFFGELFAFIRVDSSQKLRRRILGRRFVEGLWAEAMLEEEAGKKVLKGISMLIIGHKNDEIQISGNNYLCDGSPDGSFTSKSATYQNFVLDYTYFGSLLRSDDIPTGYGTVIFGEQVSAEPVSFFGRYNGEELNGRVKSVRLHGIKVKDLEEIENWQRGHERTLLVRRYAEYFRDRFPDYLPIESQSAN